MSKINLNVLTFTEDYYLDGDGGLFIEYYASDEFYGYVHINKSGMYKFLKSNKTPGIKCSAYFLDFVSAEALQGIEHVKDFFSFKENINQNNDEYDNIPF